MAFQVLIGGRDYSSYIDNSSQLLTIQWELNRPQQLNLAVKDELGLFTGVGVPVREESVVVDTNVYGNATFKGFISAHPTMFLAGYVGNFATGNPIFAYSIVAASEEFQLNAKSVQLVLLPSLQGRRTGAIIRIITEFLLPGKFTYAFTDDDGEFQADFEIKAGEVWSDIVAKCCTNDRSHCWILNSVIYLAPLDDSPLGAVYDISTDPTLTGWNVAKMSVTPQPNPIKNDVVVVGAPGPRGMGKAFYVGDGFNGNFYLQTQAYGIENNILVNESWEGGINTGVWEQAGSGFVAGTGNLSMAGGSGAGSTYVRLRKALELSGSLRLVHGEFQFDQPSDGFIGCLYKDFNTLSGPMAAFYLSPSVDVVGTINFIDTGTINDGDVLTVGPISYTFRDELLDGGQPYEVLIAANIIDSVTNLYYAMAADNNPAAGVQFGIGTASHPTVFPYRWVAFTIDLKAGVSFGLSSSSGAINTSGPIVTPCTAIQALVNNGLWGLPFRTQPDHSYVLITRLHTREIHPWRSLYKAVSDPTVTYGGYLANSETFLSFEVLDFEINVTASSAPRSIVPQRIVIYSGVHQLLTPADDPFLAYVLLQANNLNLAINFTEISHPFEALLETKTPVMDPFTQCPIAYNELKVRPLGFGIDQADATLTADPSGHLLQFYSIPIENIPVAGEVMEIFFRVFGTAVGRIRDINSTTAVSMLYGSPDDGIRTAIIDNFSPTPRTDEDARNAAAAIIEDSVKPNYQATYSDLHSMYCTARPIPGRMLVVNDPRFENAPLNLLVSQIEIRLVGDHFTQTDCGFVTIRCGTQLNADKFAALLRRKGDAFDLQNSLSVEPIDVSEVGTAFLPSSINDWGIEPYGEFDYKIGILDPRASNIDNSYQIEVRKWDRGWGQVPPGAPDAGLLVRTPSISTLMGNGFSVPPDYPIFLVPRTARNKYFYMRFVKNGVYSSVSAYCKVGFPLVAIGVINIVAIQTGSRAITIDFDIPVAGFQDLWRIIIKAPDAANESQLKVYRSILWDATTFKYRKVIIERTLEEIAFTTPFDIEVNSANLFGEQRVVIAKCDQKLLVEKGKATFGSQDYPQPVGQYGNYYMVRDPDQGGDFFEAVYNCKNPEPGGTLPLIFDVERSIDFGQSWASIFDPANQPTIPPNDSSQHKTTVFAPVPNNGVRVDHWLRITLMSGSNEGSEGIEFVVRWA